MTSVLGNRIKMSVFGESHSKAIGMVLDGIAAGEKIDIEELAAFLQRRAPGRSNISTKRKETDNPIILSGIYNGLTTGTPISVIIENTDVKSEDYNLIRRFPRPSHSDYSAFAKYGKAHDIRGGGHFSGRLTAPLCTAGAICIQILERLGINVYAHIKSIGNISDDNIENIESGLDILNNSDFPVLNKNIGEKMKVEIINAGKRGDSLGGTIGCRINGVPPGIGEPMFDGIENSISRAVFGIPAVKGIEFGSGFSGSRLFGSQNNDEFYFENGNVKTKTNNCGGILGGISNGMPINFCVAFKPTPSIGIEQNTVDLEKKENAKLTIEGRHDPCIVPRAVPCVEAAAALVIMDLFYERYGCGR